MSNLVVCPVCGFKYETTPEGACGACPLHSDCAMACCPACGHTTIDTQKSSLVRLLQRWFKPGKAEHQMQAANIQVTDLYVEDTPPDAPEGLPSGLTLEAVRPGEYVRVNDFDPILSLQHRLRLQAFGLVAGRELQVIQQRPVTIVRIDQLELAVEDVLARRIYIRAV